MEIQEDLRNALNSIASAIISLRLQVIQAERETEALNEEMQKLLDNKEYL